MGIGSWLFGSGVEGAGKGVNAALGGIGTLAKDLRSAITGEISPERKADLEEKLAGIEGQLAVAQAEVNKAEAKHASIFVAGWRPFIGWVGGFALAWHFIGHPLMSWVVVIMEIDVTPPTLSAEGLISIVLGMLGLGGLRSWEKQKGINNAH